MWKLKEIHVKWRLPCFLLLNQFFLIQTTRRLIADANRWQITCKDLVKMMRTGLLMHRSRTGWDQLGLFCQINVLFFICCRKQRRNMTKRRRSTAQCWRSISACQRGRRSHIYTRWDVMKHRSMIVVMFSGEYQSVSFLDFLPTSQADNQVDNVRQHFYEVSLEYVFKVQEVQERKMFDFVEPVRSALFPLSLFCTLQTFLFPKVADELWFRGGLYYM